MIREFANKHMKSSQIKIDQELNRYIWQKGKTNPPRKVRVRLVKDEDDQVIVSLYEDIVKEAEIKPVEKESDSTKDSNTTEETNDSKSVDVTPSINKTKSKKKGTSKTK